MATPVAPKKAAAPSGPFRTAASSFSWVDKSPTHSVLNLEVIVVNVIGRKEDSWIVTSSHGQPDSDFGAKESAQRYAVKFAATMTERTLTKLSELESMRESPTHGWKPVACYLVTLQVDAHDGFLDDAGEVRPDVFEQHRQAEIDTWRTRLRAILQGLDR